MKGSVSIRLIQKILLNYIISKEQTERNHLILRKSNRKMPSLYHVTRKQIIPCKRK